MNVSDANFLLDSDSPIVPKRKLSNLGRHNVPPKMFRVPIVMPLTRSVNEVYEDPIVAYLKHEIEKSFRILIRESTLPRKEDVCDPLLEEELGRLFISFSPSTRLVSDFCDVCNKAIGRGLFAWITGLTVSNEDAAKLLEEAVVGALSGLAAILRQEGKRVGESIVVSGVLRNFLVGGIATRLGRIDSQQSKHIADRLIAELENALLDSRYEVNGMRLYKEDGKLKLCLLGPIKLSHIIANKDDWTVRNVSL